MPLDPKDEDFLEKKNDRLESVPDTFVNQVNKLEPRIMREIEDLLAQLETENGQLLLTDRNLSLIANINQRVKDIIFDEQYTKDLTGFIQEFKTQADLNNQYFTTIIDAFELKPTYTAILRSSQRNAIQLLNEDAFTQVLIQPLQQTLESSLVNKTPFNEVIKNLRFIIEGDDEVDGRMTSHVKRIAYDAFSVSDRSYTNIIATDLGLEFYRYSGGKVKDTRCFCKERMGNFYHKKEIEQWGDGKNVGSCGYPWQGMNSNTDKATIFYYAGGYNCKHAISPVSKRDVPKNVIIRATEKGYIK